MKQALTIIFAILFLSSALPAADIIGQWLFNAEKPLEDASGHNHTIKLRGKAQIVEDERFGIALKSTGSIPSADNAQGADAGNHADFTPKGAFAFDFWLKPDEAIRAGRDHFFLIDKKIYHYFREFEKANLGYCCYLLTRGKDLYSINVNLGFKTDSVVLETRPVSLPVNEWHHLAFSYDGDGTVRVFMDGQMIAKKHFANRKAVAPSPYMLILGDRATSNYSSFIGRMAQIRYFQEVPAEYGPHPTISFSQGRTVFYHNEKNAAVTLTIDNDNTEIMDDGIVTITVNGAKHELPFKKLAPREIRQVTVPIDTSLKASSYQIDATLNSLNAKSTFDIVPRENPFMPVVMWGTCPEDELTYIGFTHDLRHFSNFPDVWKAKKPLDLSTVMDVTSNYNLLNNYMKKGLHACMTTAPGRWIEQTQTNPEYKRVTRNGKPRETTNGAVGHPDIQEFGYNVGASVAQTYMQFPSFDSALIHSEVRDNTMLSFQPFEVKSAEAFLGTKIPQEVRAKTGVPYLTLPNFPPSRVIPDDDTILRFYTWFWKDGDGWNPLHSRIHDGLKSTGRKDFWTFFDPAVRVPSVWGSGGHVDIVSQWTYSYPDPIKIGQSCDELFAMAEGYPNQKVMKMTQIIWYRSGTAPVERMPKEEDKRVQWERDIPDAKFISIAPDHLEIALWSMIARPVRGIMYHGRGSLFTTTGGSYRMTNKETAPRLSKLVHNVIQPLGPSLLEIQDAKSRVAVLESFASQMYAQCGSNGWSNSWEADMHIILQWAGYQPQIIYDETVRKNGLDAYDVLVMPNCYVLTQSVYDEILKFQKRGGIVVADERLCPAVLPDLLVPAYKRTRKADVDKAALQAMAANLRNELDPFFTRDFQTSNMDIVGRMRRFGDTDYLFLINDKRTYGDYVGQYGLVMEKGLDNAGTAWLPGDGYIYDLVAHKQVPTTPKDGGLLFDVSFGPGEGKLFMRTKTPLDAISINVDGDGTAPRGSEVPLTVQVETARNGPILPKAVVPVKLTILDADGKPAEFSGYHAAVNGELKLNLSIPSNEKPGKWTITAENLANGGKVQTTLTIK
ncbi:MAG: hypothetical protein J5743_14640 [Victivallales bacterium]|nr:hypothetical protein [Victivallales bacterium]